MFRLKLCKTHLQAESCQRNNHLRGDTFAERHCTPDGMTEVVQCCKEVLEFCRLMLISFQASTTDLCCEMLFDLKSTGRKTFLQAFLHRCDA